MGAADAVVAPVYLDRIPVGIVVFDVDIAVAHFPAEGAACIVVPAAGGVVDLIAIAAGGIAVTVVGGGDEAPNGVKLAILYILSPAVLVVGTQIAFPVAVGEVVGDHLIVGFTTGKCEHGRQHGHHHHNCGGKILLHNRTVLIVITLQRYG